MSGFENNKIIGALFLSALLILIIFHLSNIIIPDEEMDEELMKVNVYYSGNVEDSALEKTD